jgi:predicted lipase
MQVLAEQGMPDKLMQMAADHPTYTITFTGHSLGGAAATVGAVDLAVRFGVERARLQVLTFGTPRPGDSSFAHLLHGSVGTAYR